MHREIFKILLMILSAVSMFGELAYAGDPPYVSCPSHGWAWADSHFVSHDFSAGDPEGGQVTVTVYDVSPAPINIPYVVANHVEWDVSAADCCTTFTISLRATDNEGLTNDCDFLVEVHWWITPLKVFDPGCTDKLILSWCPVSREYREFRGYNVYRSDTLGVPWDQVNDTLIRDTLYVDEGLQPREDYFYYVTAVTDYNEDICTWIQNGLPTCPVVLVHGWVGHQSDWNIFKTFLEGDGFQNIWVPQLDGWGGHEQNANLLNTFIESKKDSIESYVENTYGFEGVRPSQVDIVAHSMGGLISRQYIHSFASGKVNNLIMLGTPNKGQRVATDLSSKWFLIGFFVPPAVRECSIPFVTDFNKRVPNDPSVTYTLIAGDSPVGYDEHGEPIYSWVDYPPNDQFIWVGSVLAIPSDFQAITGDEHNQLRNNFETYRKYIYPRLTESPPPISILAHDFPYLSREPFPAVTSDSNEQWLPPCSRTIFSTQVSQDTFWLDSCSNANLGICWFEGDLNLSLIDPNNIVVDSTYGETHPNIKYISTRGGEPIKSIMFAIRDPIPGMWILETTALTTPDTGTIYLSLVSLQSLISFLTWTDQYCHEVNDSVLISASLKKDTVSIAGANVITHVEKPDHSIEDVILFDDGLHNDGYPNDGIYANHFINTSLESLYIATVDAFGSLNGSLFGRQEFVGFTVYQACFIRGDANGSGLIELGDVVYLITYLYKNGPSPDPLLSGDANCSGEVELGDVVYLITYLYKGGPPPPC